MIARRLAVLLWALGACSARQTAPAEPPASALRGTVTFRGVPPKLKRPKTFDVPGLPGGFQFVDQPFVDAAGGVQGAFVYVKRGLEGRRFPIPESPSVLYATELMYEPRVLGVRVGQPLEIRNLDRVLHAAHPLFFLNREYGRGQRPPPPEPERFVFGRSEIPILIRCDVHPWMKAWVGVVEHPFFSVTDEQGKFELINVPAGKYTVGVWHERLIFEDQEIVVSGDTTMDFIGVLK